MKRTIKKGVELTQEDFATLCDRASRTLNWSNPIKNNL